MKTRTPHPAEFAKGSAGSPLAGLRRATRFIPARWRGAALLAAIILLFPVIVAAMVLEAVTGDLLPARQLLGEAGEKPDSNPQDHHEPHKS